MNNRRVVPRSRPHTSRSRTTSRSFPSRCPSRASGRSSSATSTSPSSRPSARDSTARRPTCRRSGSASRSRTRPLGRVVRSNHPAYEEGEILHGFNDWDDYVLVSDDTLLLDRLAPEAGMPLSYYVGALGGSGTTAYVGLHDVGGIQAGETVVISAAAGGRGERRRADRAPAGVPRRRTRRLGRQGRRGQGPPGLRRGHRLPRGARSRGGGTGGVSRWRGPVLRQRGRADAGRDAREHEVVRPDRGLRDDGGLQPAGRAAAGAQPVGGRRAPAADAGLPPAVLPRVDPEGARGAARVGAVRRAAGPGERHARPPSRARGLLQPDGRQHGRQDVARARRTDLHHPSVATLEGQVS
jgi:hypothetical protein